MSEKDEKLLAALTAYDQAAVGSCERIAAANQIERHSAGICERDFYKIAYEYARRRG